MVLHLQDFWGIYLTVHITIITFRSGWWIGLVNALLLDLLGRLRRKFCRRRHSLESLSKVQLSV